MEKLQHNKWYYTVEDLKQSINKYIVCSYGTPLEHPLEQWIMIPKKIIPSPNGTLFKSKIYGFYICKIYPYFHTYHTPTKDIPEGKINPYSYYCNAQQSFRLATNDEIKRFHKYWSKVRIMK